MRTHRLILLLLTGVLASLLSACGGLLGAPPAPTQPPGDYLSTALDWIAAHAVNGEQVDWPAIRRQAQALAPAPQSAAATYPAIKFALEQLGDYGFLLGPSDMTELPGPGAGVLSTDGLVFTVDPGGPAEAAGVRPGDVVEAVNGQALRPFNGWRPRTLTSWGADFGRVPTYTLALRHAGQTESVVITVVATKVSQSGTPTARRLPGPGPALGYLDLPADAGLANYQTLAHHAIRDADSSAVCGWMLDLRRNTGGDIWTMLAAAGPMLGEGPAGGFVYRDGQHDSWAYRDGKVFWNADVRDESTIDGGVYQVHHALPPVAVLTSHVTQAAGELLVVAFRGRPATRSFGEPTSGAPVLIMHTALSDGAELIVSGAYALDRTGTVYKGPVRPDQEAAIDWAQLGTDGDSLVQIAAAWLRAQPGCAP